MVCSNSRGLAEGSLSGSENLRLLEEEEEEEVRVAEPGREPEPGRERDWELEGGVELG